MGVKKYIYVFRWQGNYLRGNVTQRNERKIVKKCVKK